MLTELLLPALTQPLTQPLLLMLNQEACPNFLMLLQLAAHEQGTGLAYDCALAWKLLAAVKLAQVKQQSVLSHYVLFLLLVPTLLALSHQATMRVPPPLLELSQ